MRTASETLPTSSTMIWAYLRNGDGPRHDVQQEHGGASQVCTQMAAPVRRARLEAPALAHTGFWCPSMQEICMKSRTAAHPAA